MTPDLRDRTEYTYGLLATEPPWATNMRGVYWRSYPMPTLEEMRAARAHSKHADSWILP